jgi:hypothetical protein
MSKSTRINERAELMEKLEETMRALHDAKFDPGRFGIVRLERDQLLSELTLVKAIHGGDAGADDAQLRRDLVAKLEAVRAFKTRHNLEFPVPGV